MSRKGRGATGHIASWLKAGILLRGLYSRNCSVRRTTGYVGGWLSRALVGLLGLAFVFLLAADHFVGGVK
jgi:hypothetical protein